MNMGPYKTYVSDGLRDSVSNIYDLLQDNIASNTTAALRAIINEPGLKIQGSEFSCTIVGDTIRIQTGAVVFSDYSVYIPGNSNAHVILDLPDTSYELAYLFLVAEDETSHPYPVKGTDDADLITWRGISFELRDSTIVPAGEISYRLADLYVENDTWEVYNRRFSHILKISGSSRNANGSYGEGESIGATVSTKCLFNYQKDEVDNLIFDKLSYQYDTGYGAVITVGWTSEVYDETYLEPTYYKIELSPPRHPGHTIQKTILDSGEEEQVSISIPASIFTEYEVRIYRICDPIEQIVEDTGFFDTVVAGRVDDADPECPFFAPKASRIGLGKGVNIYNNGSIPSSHFYQIFVSEDSAVIPHPEVLVYEGDYREFVYFPHDDTTTIYIKLRAVNRTTFKYCESQELSLDVSTGTVDSYVTETPLQFCATNIDCGAVAGTTHTVHADFPLDPDYDTIINRISCSMNQGAGNEIIDPSGLTPFSQKAEQLWDGAMMEGPGVITISDGAGVALIRLPFDTRGNGYYAPSTPVVIEAGTDITIEIDSRDATKICNPLGLHIILYTVGGWMEIQNTP